MADDSRPFRGFDRIQARALQLGERIDVRPLERAERLAIQPLVVRAGGNGLAVVFRYGVVVLFNLQPLEEVAFLDMLRPLVAEPVESPESETAAVDLGPGEPDEVVSGGVIRLRDVAAEPLQLVADVMAKSVVLADYERRLAGVFDRVEPIALALKAGQRGRAPMAHLLAQIGDALLMQHKMVGRVEVTEKPDLLWERPDLERLYARLAAEYELAERDRALKRKLDLVSQTVATSLDLVQARRTLRVEWYIVILIVVEIVLTLYELFVRGH
jgi:uncharacterized Rmd1/YagE family protein